MGKDKQIRIETKFSNGSVSFRMIDDRLVKLSKSTIDDLVSLVAGRLVGGDSVFMFQQLYLNSNELVCGPNNEQKQVWSETAMWEHTPYLYLHEVIAITGLLTERDFSALSNFTVGCEWRQASAYWAFRRQFLSEPSPLWFKDRNMTCTTIVSQEEFEAMKRGTATA